MQFQLPAQLQQQLLEYDPVLKSLAKAQKTTSKTKKASHPLGKPHQLIPTEVLKESLYNEAVTHINSVPAADRYQLFTRVENNAIVPYAILYHFEQVWYAAWLPPKHKQGEYIYGYSYTFKDNTTAHKMLPLAIRNNLDNLQTYQIGRVNYFTYSKQVSKQDVIDGQDRINWNVAGVASYYKKSGQLYTQIDTFGKQVYNTIPSWTDSRSVFDRIKATTPAYVLFSSPVRNTVLACSNYWKQNDINKATVSYQLLFDLITYYAHSSNYDGYVFKDMNKILHIITTPFFRKWIQSKCDEINTMFYKPDNNLLKNITAPWYQIVELFGVIQKINNIWPECPIDYYQNHIPQLLSIKSTNWGSTLTFDWLRVHMPVSSFFLILSKEYEKTIETAQTRYTWDENLQVRRFYYSNWTDTLQMLTVILEHNANATEPLALDVPKRWRLMEFHDHVQSISWKVKNKNEKLPQDLFPEPIKIELGSSRWTFFQPIDTHQLAAWGQAVRNCVGSASGYAEGVRKKKHFIVLCMIDNKPMFTIQLEVAMGTMTVKQIAGVSNASLKLEERELYTTAFAQALKERDNALVSA